MSVMASSAARMSTQPSVFRRLLRGSAKIGLAGSIAGGAYAGYLYNTDEGSRRVLTVYAYGLPVVAAYRTVEAKHMLTKPDDATASAEWRALDEKYAAVTIQKLAELQGMFVKYGQTAAGFSNTFSDVWIKEMRKLEDQVPPRSVATVHQTILEETGKPWQQTFKKLEETPLGSASIGQVHKATLHDGREVAIKVQYPDSERLFRKDMGTIRSFFTAVAPEQLYMLTALEEQNSLELDYTIEAANLEYARSNLSSPVLMDPLDGPSINDELAD